MVKNGEHRYITNTPDIVRKFSIVFVVAFLTCMIVFERISDSGINEILDLGGADSSRLMLLNGARPGSNQKGEFLSSTVIGLGSDLDRNKTIRDPKDSSARHRSQNLISNYYSCSSECNKNYGICIKASSLTRSRTHAECEDIIRDCRRVHCTKENWNDESEAYKERKLQCWRAAQNNWG